jgi:hypothetical protein
LESSKAFSTGLIVDVSEAELYIDGVGRDTISDLTTNIIRGRLATYTAEQCELHDVPTQKVAALGPEWSLERRDWQSRIYNLPVHEGKPILLVPKSSVRRSLSLDSQEFYNAELLSFLQAEYLDAGGALVQALRNGKKRVTKRSLKEVHPFSKSLLAEFVNKHPEVLEHYKKLKGAKGPLEPDQLDDSFDEEALAQSLIAHLRSIPTGTKAADQYHTFVIGLLVFLFHPDLIYPVKEEKIHGGRKRVDIKFRNAATDGFFHRMISNSFTGAYSVWVECKNYTNDIGNAEWDQLSGRFNPRQGKLGFLLCRSLTDKAKALLSCRDTALDH